MIKTFYEDSIKPFIKIILTILAFVLAFLFNNLNAKLDEVYRLLLEVKIANATIMEQIQDIKEKNKEQDIRIEKVETKLEQHIIRDKQ